MKNLFASVNKIIICSVLFFSVFNVKAQQGLTMYERGLQVVRHNTNQTDENILRGQMRAEGIFEEVIDKVISQRRIWMQHNMNVNWVNVTKKNLPIPTPNAACGGLGVLSNTWGAWVGQQGDNSSGPNASNITWQPQMSPPTPTTLFNITSGAGIDPNTPGPNPGDPSV